MPAKSIYSTRWPLLMVFSIAAGVIMLLLNSLSASASSPGAVNRAPLGDVLTPTITATITLTPTPTLTETATSTPTPTGTVTPTITLTSTETVTPSETATPTITPTPTPTETLTPTATPTAARVHLPMIFRLFPLPTSTPTATPTPTSGPTREPFTRLFCASLPQPIPIPDNDPGGMTARLSIAEPGLVLDLDLYVRIDHTWAGDLRAMLAHYGGDTITALDRPGFPASQFGCGQDNVIAILDDEGSLPVEGRCGGIRPSVYAPPVAAVGGVYRPDQPLSVFIGESAAGDWLLNLADLAQNDAGALEAWCLEMTIGDTLPTPTPTPTPYTLPPQAMITGMTGEDQAYQLDCESRSAVDWAARFGKPIGELEFFWGLPTSDNPDAGFVGNVHGDWGQIPPNDYGVHAAPIANRLKGYGLSATAARSLSWEALRAEVAAGRPVIVWVIGPVANGSPVYYTASDGKTTVVARYEHTVIVVGYSQSSVWVLNGAPPYDEVSSERFLESWSALRNMAVIATTP